MRRWVCLTLWFAGCSAILTGEPDIRVVAGIEEDGEALVGQRRTFYIELQTDTWFSGAIEITPPRVDGVILAQLETFGINGTVRQDGTTFTTHRKEFALFALNPGSVMIPAGQVKAQIADPGKPSIAYAGESPQTLFEAVMPEGVAWEGPLLTTRSLTLRESWDHEPGPGSVGDAFQRTISVEADNIMAMVFPPFPAPELDGVRIYRDAPQVEDKTGRGDLTGSRTERLTYVFEKPGQYVLPEVNLAWWNEQTSELKVERIAEVVFSIEPIEGVGPSVETQESVNEGTSGFAKRLGFSAIVLVLACGLGAFLYARLRHRRATSPREREQVRFSDLLRAIEKGELPDIYRTWRSWMDSFGSAAIDLPAPVLQLEQVVSGYSEDFDRPAFLLFVRNRRKELIADDPGANRDRLPGLNPNVSVPNREPSGL